MIEQFLNHIRKNQLCKATDRILLAVSGGVDSMVMLDLFHHTGFDVAVAHCNFQLRPEEAMIEETLVSGVCASKGVPFFVKHFNTTEYAAAKGLSIQVAARELRYDFFEWVAGAHGFSHIATAHHANDVVETVLLNLVRGTGIEGITGIPLTNGKVIRPMLFASREQIVAYASAQQIPWREDSSNQESHYSRNAIRNQVMPVLQSLNPNLEAGFQLTLERLQGTRAFSSRWLEDLRDKYVVQSGDELRIGLAALGDKHGAVVLWEWLKASGFNYDQCRQMVIVHAPGRRFFSGTHQVIVDRDVLIVTKRSEPVLEWHSIEPGQTEIVTVFGRLQMSVASVADFDKTAPATIAQFDLKRLTFPLLCRNWEPGDSLVPLGMQHRKKLSDLLIDNKFSLQEKERVLVIESAGEIIWVVGLRISDLVKITPVTTEIFIMEWCPTFRPVNDKTQD